MNPFSVSRLGIGDGAPAVDVRHAVGDDDADVGHVGPVAVDAEEHLVPHRLDGVGGVGAAEVVGDAVDGRFHVRFALVLFQVEPHLDARAVGDHAHAHVPVVDVGDLQKVLGELQHLDKVLLSDARR